MPIYEFRCQACGAEFEALVAVGAQPPCAECAQPRARRVYSPPAAPFRLVATPAGARRRERRNAALRADAKARFRAARSPARSAPGRSDGER